MTTQRTISRGFTLPELLVVIAIILFLISLIVSSASLMRRSSMSILDATNHRQLAIANINYTTDYQGQWLNPMTSNDIDTWVDCFGSNLGAGNIERVTSITEGSAWEYVGDIKVYKSPEDPSTRIRSYSLNSQVGVRPNGYHVSGGYGPSTFTITTIPMPERTLLTISEHSEWGYNPQGWYVGIPNTGWEGCWVDFPAYHNPKGVNVGYVDGSVSFYAFKDPLLPQLVTHASTWGVTGQDLDFFANIMFPGWDGEW